MLEPFGPGIWIAGGAEVAVAGFRYPTRMTVIRLEDGGLFVCSPVALSSALRDAVSALGPVACIVAPNALHDLFLAEWREAYPAARLYAPPRLAALRQGLAFDEELGDAPALAWRGQIEQRVVRGNAITDEVVFFHQASRTAVFTDLIQQFPPGWFKGWRALVARLDLMTAAEPTVPRKFRVAFTDRKTARASLAPILAWPADKVLMAHGRPVTADGQGFLRRAFAWMG